MMHSSLVVRQTIVNDKLNSEIEEPEGRKVLGGTDLPAVYHALFATQEQISALRSECGPFRNSQIPAYRQFVNLGKLSLFCLNTKLPA